MNQYVQNSYNSAWVCLCMCMPSHPYMRVHVHISHLTNVNYLYICLYSWLLLVSGTNWLDLMEGKHEPTPLPSCHRFQTRHAKSSFKRNFFFQRLEIACCCCCCCSLAQSNLTLCDPIYYSMSGLPVLHHLLELAQTQVHWVGDAIQPSQRDNLCFPLILLPSVFHSIKVFSRESVLCIRWPECSWLRLKF